MMLNVAKRDQYHIAVFDGIGPQVSNCMTVIELLCESYSTRSYMVVHHQHSIKYTCPCVSATCQLGAQNAPYSWVGAGRVGGVGESESGRDPFPTEFFYVRSQ